MPLYEYRCEKCGRVTEFLESFQSRAEHVCPHCRAKRMSKLISSCAVSDNAGKSSGSCGPGSGSFS